MQILRHPYDVGNSQLHELYEQETLQFLQHLVNKTPEHKFLFFSLPVEKLKKRRNETNKRISRETKACRVVKILSKNNLRVIFTTLPINFYILTRKRIEKIKLERK